MANANQINGILRAAWIIGVFLILCLISMCSSGCSSGHPINVEKPKITVGDKETNGFDYDRECIVSGMKYRVFSNRYNEAVEVRNITLDSLMVAEFKERYPNTFKKDSE